MHTFAVCKLGIPRICMPPEKTSLRQAFIRNLKNKKQASPPLVNRDLYGGRQLFFILTSRWLPRNWCSHLDLIIVNRKSAYENFKRLSQEKTGGIAICFALLPAFLLPFKRDVAITILWCLKRCYSTLPEDCGTLQQTERDNLSIAC